MRSVSPGHPGAVGLWMLLTPGIAGSGPGTEALQPRWGHWGLCGPHLGQPPVLAAPYPAVHWALSLGSGTGAATGSGTLSSAGGSQHMQCVQPPPAPLQHLCQALWCRVAAGTPLPYFWAAASPSRPPHPQMAPELPPKQP